MIKESELTTTDISVVLNEKAIKIIRDISVSATSPAWRLELKRAIEIPQESYSLIHMLDSITDHDEREAAVYALYKALNRLGLPFIRKVLKTEVYNLEETKKKAEPKSKLLKRKI